MLTRMLVPKPKNAFQSPGDQRVGLKVEGAVVAVMGITSVARSDDALEGWLRINRTSANRGRNRCFLPDATRRRAGIPARAPASCKGAGRRRTNAARRAVVAAVGRG